MADAGLVERAQHQGMRVALDRVEYPAWKQLKELPRRRLDHVRAQAEYRIARRQRLEHGRNVGELPGHLSPLRPHALAFFSGTDPPCRCKRAGFKQAIPI